jgi:hypothetical protein
MLRQTDAFLAASMSAAIASTIQRVRLVLALMGSRRSAYRRPAYAEIGIRMASAPRAAILALMMREGARRSRRAARGNGPNGRVSFAASSMDSTP